MLCEISEKTNEQILRKTGYKHTYGRAGVQACIYRTSPNKGPKTLSCLISDQGIINSSDSGSFVHFGTICTIWKTRKTPMEDCYF